MNLETAYALRQPQLQEAAREIQVELQELLKNVQRIDNVSVRAKSVARFLEKVNRKEYAHPLQDIQDQIGARVVVYYKSDVEVVKTRILSEFRIVEGRQMEDADPGRFGYQARHYICFVPPDIRYKTRCPVDFFELQISTLFQHAWAEANHDLGYKPEAPLDFEEQRKIAWAAAQAWGADVIFDEIWRTRNSEK